MCFSPGGKLSPKEVPLQGPKPDRSSHGGSWDKNRTRINFQIRVPEVRVVDEDGSPLGIMPTRDALKIAQDKGLDLVEVASQANPPVCKIIDFGKYKYEQKQREKAAKKRVTKSTLKELKFRPKIGKHDINVRVRHARKFLLKGNKVRLVVRFRGREHSHPHIAEALLNGVYKQLEDLSDIETPAKKEGSTMIMNITPNSQKIKTFLQKTQKPDSTSPGDALSDEKALADLIADDIEEDELIDELDDDELEDDDEDLEDEELEEDVENPEKIDDAADVEQPDEGDKY
jgi:translation initiation factor IF-3